MRQATRSASSGFNPVRGTPADGRSGRTSKLDARRGELRVVFGKGGAYFHQRMRVLPLYCAPRCWPSGVIVTVLGSPSSATCGPAPSITHSPRDTRR
jgi:hypothetical protein